MTVIELGQIIAAPFASCLLADMGANVIKIENPGKGDSFRRAGPQKDGEGLWFKVMNRNKKSVTVDLHTPGGQDLIRRLAAKADLVVENFRPGTLEEWNIGWEHLHAVNPRLIMLRISGYGQVGPDRMKSGYGRVGEAMSGAVFLTGFPENPPTHVGFSLGDLSTGLMGAFAAASALYRAKASGDTFAGESIDLALYDSLFRMIDWQAIVYDQLGLTPERQGNRFPVGPSPINETFKSRDGHWVTISSGTVVSIQRVLRLVGREDLIKDPRFVDHEGQMANRDELVHLVNEWIKVRDLDEVMRLTAKFDVVCGKIFNASDMFVNATFAARQSLVKVLDPKMGEVTVPGVVPRLENYPGQVRHIAPEVGQNTNEVLQGWLGLSAAEVAGLRTAGAI